MGSPSATAKTVFFDALEIASAEERRALLDARCSNVELRRAVEELLRHHEQINGFLETPPTAVASLADTAREEQATVDRPASMQAGTQIGAYRLLQVIGEGGMGVVYLARQTEPVQREVAVKIIKPGMDSRQVIARFEAERQALALMDHPNIAKVVDAGTTENGQPFFVMELVKGVPITKYCDDKRLSVKQRLELMSPVCQAIQHAHQKGIIHRDIKPTNILVAEYEGQVVPKVIDFGVAKATAQKLAERTMFTQLGQVVGTLEYMSPEQAELNQLDIDTRSDIYSLGVLLYELLTGTTPFDKQKLHSAAFYEMLRIIREEEPPKPSTRLSTIDALSSVAANRKIEPGRLSKVIRGELDWIVMKALEKDRGRRYESAAGFAADLERYLNDEPVQAGPPSAWYRMRKFVRRNRAAVLTAAAILLALVAGIAGTTFGLIRAEHRRAEAEQARANEAAQRTIADDQRKHAEEARASEAAQRQIADAQKKQAEEARAAEGAQRQIADDQRKKAEKAEADTLASFRASTDDAIEQLIGAKPDLGPQERAYLWKTLKRWEAFAERQGDDERSQAIRAEGHYQVASFWQKLGRSSEARQEYETARDLYAKLTAAFPAEPKYQRTLALTTNGLGIVLGNLGQGDAARTQYESARDLNKKLVAAYPAVAEYQSALGRSHQNLGILLNNLGQRDAARKEYEAALNLQQKLAADFPAVLEYQWALSYTHNGLGVLLYDLGQGDAARTKYELARDLRKKLAAAFPAMPQYQSELAGTHLNLGVVLKDLGQRDAARKEYEAARDLQLKLAAAFPATPRYQIALAVTHNTLGVLLKDLGQRDAARTEYEQARDLEQKLVAAFPATPRYQTELARTHNNLGNLLAELGQHDAARTELETALNLKHKLVAAYPAVPAYRVSLGGSYCNVGEVVRNEGHPADSLHWFDLAIRTLTAVYEQDRPGITGREFLRNSHWGRAEAYDLLHKHKEAILDWNKAIELDAGVEQPILRGRLAISRLKAGQTAEVVAEVDEFLTKTPIASGGDWHSFACVYALASSKFADQKQVYGDRAMELLRQAVQAGYTNAAQLTKDRGFDPLRQREDFQKLLAELQNRNQ